MFSLKFRQATGILWLLEKEKYNGKKLSASEIKTRLYFKKYDRVPLYLLSQLSSSGLVEKTMKNGGWVYEAKKKLNEISALDLVNIINGGIHISHNEFGYHFGYFDRSVSYTIEKRLEKVLTRLLRNIKLSEMTPEIKLEQPVSTPIKRGRGRPRKNTL